MELFTVELRKCDNDNLISYRKQCMASSYFINEDGSQVRVDFEYHIEMNALNQKEITIISDKTPYVNEQLKKWVKENIEL